MGLDRGDVVTISSLCGHPGTELPPGFDGACQVFAGIAGNGKALQPDGAWELSRLSIFSTRPTSKLPRSRVWIRRFQGMRLRLAAVGPVDADGKQIGHRFA